MSWMFAPGTGWPEEERQVEAHAKSELRYAARTKPDAPGLRFGVAEKVLRCEE